VERDISKFYVSQILAAHPGEGSYASALAGSEWVVRLYDEKKTALRAGFAYYLHLNKGAVSLGVKRQARETGHSSPSSSEVKNAGDLSQLPSTSSWLGA
jgi:hypothetical protein